VKVVSASVSMGDEIKRCV